MNWGTSNIAKLPYKAPRILDINLYRNTTWLNTIDFRDTSDNTPIDISGYDFALTVKRNAFDTKVIKKLALGDGLSVSGTGKDILTINTFVDIKAGAYVYDLIGTKPTGEIIPYLKGKIKVEENV